MKDNYRFSIQIFKNYRKSIIKSEKTGKTQKNYRFSIMKSENYRKSILFFGRLSKIDIFLLGKSEYFCLNYKTPFFGDEKTSGRGVMRPHPCPSQPHPPSAPSPKEKGIGNNFLERGFFANNFHELADSPFIASNALQHDSFLSAGVTFNI